MSLTVHVKRVCLALGSLTCLNALCFDLLQYHAHPFSQPRQAAWPTMLAVMTTSRLKAVSKSSVRRIHPCSIQPKAQQSHLLPTSLLPPCPAFPSAGRILSRHHPQLLFHLRPLYPLQRCRSRLSLKRQHLSVQVAQIRRRLRPPKRFRPLLMPAIRLPPRELLTQPMARMMWTRGRYLTVLT